MSERDTIDLIRKRLSSMPAVGKRIGSYILAHPQQVTEMTLRNLAVEVGVAEGSIINFTE